MMGPEIKHELDPEGDTILTLRNPNAPFADWEAREKWPTEVVESTGPKDLEDNGPEAVLVVEPPEPTDPTEPRDDEPADVEEDVQAEPEEIRMKLSSKHLILASPYFRKMLCSEWKESAATADGRERYAVGAEDWDESALVMLMEIIHGRTRNIPRQVGLETLAKIAVLVDYYRCHEAVAFFADVWISSLYEAQEAATSPRKCDRNLTLWLTVLSVFSSRDKLRIMMKIAVEHGRMPIHTLGLPIPGTLVGKHSNDSSIRRGAPKGCPSRPFPRS